MATLSIVIPVYNVAGYIASCLDSILAQRCDNIEIVIVDDRSTDDSGAICDRYARDHANLHVHHLQENQGVAAARNRGLAEATGDYVTFVDGDDCLIDGALRRVTELIDRLGEVDIVICRFASESGVLSNDVMFVPEAQGRLEAEVVLKHLTQIDYYLDHCWPYVINRGLIVRHHIRFIKSTIAEDAEYIDRLFALAGTAAYCGGEFYLYRERDGSLKNSKGVAETIAFLQVAHALWRLAEAGDRSDVQKNFLQSQIHHALGVFSARLSLLGPDDLRCMAAMIGFDQLPPALRAPDCNDVLSSLSVYRDAIESATLSLVATSGTRPIYIYCTGPTCEATMTTLRKANYAVRKVIDDNTALSGRSVLGTPIISGAQFAALAAEEIATALVVICVQKKAAHAKIERFLIGCGLQQEQIVHRVF